MTALAMLFKPFLMLAFFAVVVIPLRLIILRIVPRSWHPLLLWKPEPWQHAVVWVCLMAAIISYGLLLPK